VLKNIFKYNKIAIIFFIILSFPFLVYPAYAYWDKLNYNNQVLLSTGEWATTITTPAQFKALSEKTNSLETDVYIIMNNLNFSGTSWTYNSNNRSTTFRGKIYGNNKTISNLTISNNYNNSNYLYHGIFARIENASIYNLNFNNVNLTLNSTSLGSTRIMAGLIAGDAYGGTNVFRNITISNSGVRATSANGSGGLIGRISGSSTTVNIENIKTTNLKVFNKSSNSGGLVGRVYSSGAQLSVKDIDLDGEVFSYNATSYTGGIVGNIAGGGIVDITRVILNVTSRNTLETNSTYYNRYSQRYLGGVIGYSDSASSNVVITDVFFTGALFTQANNRRGDIGTITGSTSSINTRPDYSNTYYAYVQFRSSSGQVVYDPGATPTGQMSPEVGNNQMPTISWWNTFFTNFNLTNDYWAQNVTTGQPYLTR